MKQFKKSGYDSLPNGVKSRLLLLVIIIAGLILINLPFVHFTDEGESNETTRRRYTTATPTDSVSTALTSIEEPNEYSESEADLLPASPEAVESNEE